MVLTAALLQAQPVVKATHTRNNATKQQDPVETNFRGRESHLSEATCTAAKQHCTAERHHILQSDDLGCVQGICLTLRQHVWNMYVNSCRYQVCELTVASGSSSGKTGGLPGLLGSQYSLISRSSLSAHACSTTTVCLQAPQYGRGAACQGVCMVKAFVAQLHNPKMQMKPAQTGMSLQMKTRELVLVIFIDNLWHE